MTVVIAVAVLVALSWPLNILDIRARAPFASVASAFDAPPGYPGYGWSREGHVVDQGDLTTIAGPSHCHWETATMMFIGWPPGSRASSGPIALFVSPSDDAGVYVVAASGAERWPRVDPARLCA